MRDWQKAIASKALYGLAALLCIPGALLVLAQILIVEAVTSIIAAAEAIEASRHVR